MKLHEKNEAVVVYVASYPNLNEANADYAAVKQLYRDGVIGVYDAAVVSKDAAGHVKIHGTEKPTEYGALSGLAVGALVGIFFPPYLVWEVAAGAVIGSLIGHFWAGMSHSDLKQIGDKLQASTATLIVVCKSKLRKVLTEAVNHEIKDFEKELATDVKGFNKDLKAAVEDFLKAA
jgi:uncharacterized membrane protein